MTGTLSRCVGFVVVLTAAGVWVGHWLLGPVGP
jgi:hypothetical protein